MINSKSKTSPERTIYTQEFRDEAVRLTVTSGKSVAQISRELGIGSHRLYEWRREARYAHRLPVAESETPEQQITRLQKENELLKQERDILKRRSATVLRRPAASTASAEVAPDERFSFIAAHPEQYPVELICHLLEVSPSGYYA